MKTQATARVLSTGVPGKYSKKKKRAFDTSSNTTSARPPPPYSSISMPAPPKTATHSIEKTVGPMITPKQNSRLARPHEMRATTMPMTGPHATHQIRKVHVHPYTQPKHAKEKGRER